MKFLFHLFVFVVISTNLSANYKPDIYTKFDFSRSSSNEMSSFSYLPETISCCSSFDEGISFSNGFDVSLALELSNQIFIVPKLTILQTNGYLQKIDDELINVDGSEINSKIANKIDFDYLSLRYGVGLYYSRYNFNLGFDFMFQENFEMNYYQREKIISPRDRSYFLDSLGNRTRTRNEYKDQLNTLLDQFSLRANLSYDIPVNEEKTLYFSPFIAYENTYGELISQTSWERNSFVFGIGFKKYLHKTIIEEIEIPRIKIDSSLFFASDIIKDGKTIESKDLYYSLNSYDLKVKVFNKNGAKTIEESNYTLINSNFDYIRFFTDISSVEGIRQVILVNKDGRFIKNISSKTTTLDIMKDEILDLDREKIDFRLKIDTEDNVILSKDINHEIFISDESFREKKIDIILFEIGMKTFSADNLILRDQKVLKIISDNTILASRISKKLNIESGAITIRKSIPDYIVFDDVNKKAYTSFVIVEYE